MELERGPEADDRVEERRLAGVVLGDIHDREVVRAEREHHRESSDHDEPEADARRDPRGRERSRIASPCGVDRRPGAPEREEERGAQRGRAEIARAHARSDAPESLRPSATV